MAPRKKKTSLANSDEEDLVISENDNEPSDTPPAIDPYAELGIDTTASADEVKKAYRKLALKHHPDKAGESEKAAANKKFQEIAFAYAVLSDDRRRRRYDMTGSTAESLEEDDNFDWLQFYREQFDDLITEQNIRKISDEYKGSAEEREDVLSAYTKCKGKLDSMYQIIMLSDIIQDDDRFRQIIDEGIKNGTVESYPAYARETNAQRDKVKAAEQKRRDDFDKRHGKDAAEKTKAKRRGTKDDATDIGNLAALIQQRQKQRAGNFLDGLEARYASKSRGKKRSTPTESEEPPEEAFEANRAKLDNSKRLKTRRAADKR